MLLPASPCAQRTVPLGCLRPRCFTTPLSHFVVFVRTKNCFHRRRDDAARARLRRTLHLPRVRVEGKGTPGIGGEGGARARPEPPPCLLLLRARRRWRGMRFGCCAPGTANATTTLNAERIDVRVSGRPRESLLVRRRRSGHRVSRRTGEGLS